MFGVESIYRDFGDILRKAREKVKLTQADLGSRVGLTRTSITNIESGNQRVQLHLLFQFARALGVSAHSLLPKSSVAVSAGLFEGLTEGERISVGRVVGGAASKTPAKGRSA